MKKKILSIALLAMSLATFNGMAQTTTTDNNVKVENVKCNKADKKGQRPKMNPYEGLNLTDAQKTQLQQLDAKRRDAFKQQKQAQKDQKQAQKAQKQEDKAARMEARKAAKKEYLEEVKAIIGPDQYVVFLENMYINAGNQQKGKAMMQGQRSGKQGMAHNKSGKYKGNKNGKNRSEKGQKGSRQQSAATQS